MRITIRPAPHSKSCAHVGRGWCSRNDDHPELCETNCPEGYCCEMKHCWEVGNKLRDILVSRGHEVKMANKAYQKESTTAKANEGMKKAMEELLAWGPQLHIAIHTNSYDDVVTGVRIGYPAIANNKGEEERCRRSERLAELIVEENKKIYHTPSKVKTTTYNFYELNKPTCAAIYIEGCFANSAKKDGDWWHGNMDAIAKSYADGIDKWIAEEKEVANFMAYEAKVKTNYGNGASIWTDNKKTSRVLLVKDGEILTVTGNADSKGFVPVTKNGKSGVFDSQYLVRITPETPAPAPDNTDLLSKLQEIRVMVDEAIVLASKA